MHVTMYTKNCHSLIVFSTYPNFMHYSENVENNFHKKFVIDDGLCHNLTLCCEINAHMNTTTKGVPIRQVISLDFE